MTKIQERISAAIESIRKEFRTLAELQIPPNSLVMAIDPEVRAVGQHLRPASQQRGLLGISSTLRVITSDGKDDPAFVRGLVKYVENMNAVELAIDEKVRKSARRLVADEANVIKQAELLFALASMSGATQHLASATTLTDNLAKLLRDGATAGGSGWSYQMNGPAQASDALPTAAAIMALSQYGAPVELEANELFKRLSNNGIADPFVGVFVLYVLTFRKDGNHSRKELRRQFRRLWDAASHLMDKGLESNIEYLSFGEHVGYIRVPWQLYMVALAAELSPMWRFASPVVQKTLDSLLSDIEKKGYVIYPYSGAFPSTRTNAILHEVLCRVQKSLESGPGRIASAPILPALSRMWHSNAFLWCVRGVALAVVAYTFWRWAPDSQAWGSLATNFLATLVLGTLLWRTRK